MYNEDGEFYFTESYQLEGGHAMALVGFNDHYTTRAGFTVRPSCVLTYKQFAEA